MGERYDIAFLGGGPAGYQGAIRAAQLRAKVAVIEEREVGGVCLNRGCIPTKAVRASAETARAVRRAREYGIEATGGAPDMAAVISRKDRVVGALRSSVERLFQANRVDLIRGTGRLLGKDRIEVEGEGGRTIVEAPKVVVATGSRPSVLAALPRNPRVFVPDEMLFQPVLPARLLVVGGGVVGVEMAAIYRELGSQVTIVEALDRILSTEDREMADYLLKVLQRRKVKVLCQTSVEGVRETPEGLRALLSDGSEIEADAILQAVGRRLNTEGIGLREAGIAMDGARVIVDDHLRTSIPGIYAAGDVTGRWLLAHFAFAEGICAAENALGVESIMDRTAVPRCVFTMPEYASVGLSEEEALRGHKIKVSRFPFKGVGMAQAIGELEGLVKVIAEADTDKILGAHVIGPHAGDLIGELTVAMRAGLPSRSIMETIHVHPTLSEGILEVAQALHGRAIHIPGGGSAS